MMHAEAHAGFGRMLERVGIDLAGDWKVLDFGGQDVNGTAHDWLPNAKITTLDLYRADIIADAATWEPDQLFDVVMATELFEHAPAWPEIIAVMRRALDPHGPGILITTCASTGRLAHGVDGAPAPVDGEWYGNVSPEDLGTVLGRNFSKHEVEYQVSPGDAYAWAVA